MKKILAFASLTLAFFSTHAQQNGSTITPQGAQSRPGTTNPTGGTVTQQPGVSISRPDESNDPKHNPATCPVCQKNNGKGKSKGKKLGHIKQGNHEGHPHEKNHHHDGHEGHHGHDGHHGKNENHTEGKPEGVRGEGTTISRPQIKGNDKAPVKKLEKPKSEVSPKKEVKKVKNNNH